MAIRNIEIAGKNVGVRTTARIPIFYTDEFNGDLFADIDEVVATLSSGKVSGKVVSVVSRLAWLMAREADEDIPGYKDWLGEFEDGYAFVRAGVPIVTTWQNSTMGTVEPAKK